MASFSLDKLPPPCPEPEVPYWRRLPLAAMTTEQWEALCDGCGKCCLEKLEDDDGTIHFTNVACRQLDIDTCRCRRYADRKRVEPQCQQLTSASIARLYWLPASCAYRLLAEGRDLPWWHPLVSGDPDLVHRLGLSARGRAVPPSRRRRLEHHVVSWPA